MQITAIFSQMVVLFITVAVGYLAAKTGQMDPEMNRRLSKLVLNVTNVALILSSVLGSERAMGTKDILILTLIAVLSYVFLILISFAVPPLLRVPKEDAGTYRFLTIFNNVGFMGIPVIRVVLGPEAVFYAAIFNIPFSFLVFTYGVKLLSHDPRYGKLTLKLFLQPSVIAVLLAYVLYLLDLQYPAVLVDAANFIGQVTSPAAMLIIGCALAQLPLREMFTNVRLYILSVLKMILLPIAAYYILQLFHLNETVVIATVVMLAMPVATNATMLCAQYDGNHKLAATGIFITTVLSVGTIPLLMKLLFT